MWDKLSIFLLILFIQSFNKIFLALVSDQPTHFRHIIAVRWCTLSILCFYRDIFTVNRICHPILWTIRIAIFSCLVSGPSLSIISLRWLFYVTERTFLWPALFSLIIPLLPSFVNRSKHRGHIMVPGCLPGVKSWWTTLTPLSQAPLTLYDAYVVLP